MQNVEARGCFTVMMWFAYLGFTYIAMNALGIWVALLAFILMIPLIIAMGAIWNLFGNQTSHIEQSSETEKRKRERIDSVLRDLSDDDLMILRERLQDGSINDELLYDRFVGDDGELVQGYNEEA